MLLKMIDSDRDYEEVVTQLAAVSRPLRSDRKHSLADAAKLNSQGISRRPLAGLSRTSTTADS